MKILILGANGMIGHKIYQIISKKHPNTFVLFRKKLKFIKSNHLYNKTNDKYCYIGDYDKINNIIVKKN